MKKIILSSLLTASVLLTGTIDGNVLEASAATKSNLFSDVSPNNAYFPIYREMAEKGVINGYPDGTFRPDEKITRKHAATLINRAVDLKKIKTVKKPNDLNKNNPYYKDLMALLEAGLIETNSKGNIEPNKPLTRGEMALILAGSYDVPVKNGSHTLKDVSPKYNKAVGVLFSNGITTGYEDNTFKENQSLTRGHYAVFMHRAETATIEKIDLTKLTSKELEKLTAKEIMAQSKLIEYASKGMQAPLPAGEGNREKLNNRLIKEFDEVRNTVSFDTISQIPAAQMHRQDILENLANNLKISLAEVVILTNSAAKEGIVITNPKGHPINYVIVYDYNKELLRIGLSQ